MNHYLSLYFPEAERFLCTTRAGWFARLRISFPTPAAVTALPEAEFVSTAARLVHTKHSKEAVLRSSHAKARHSIGIPVGLESQAVATFRLLLEEHTELCRKRAALERTEHELLQGRLDYQVLRSIPGIGPIIALTILAEAGDLRRFHHERQFLKFCGLDLATAQSGAYRGRTPLSKRGNSRLRSALWMAATVAVRMTENGFRRKFDRYVARERTNADLKRKTYTACAAKMARVVYGLIKHEQFYRAYHEDTVPVPDGRTRSDGPWRQVAPAAVTS
jgi:transposase